MNSKSKEISWRNSSRLTSVGRNSGELHVFPFEREVRLSFKGRKWGHGGKRGDPIKEQPFVGEVQGGGV